MSDDPEKRAGENLDPKHKRPVIVTGLLLLALMLGMGLRLYELDADSMWLDEIITTNQAQQDLSSILTYYEYYTHPPLIDLLLRFFITVAGDSDFVLRAQAMLFGSVAILLIYKVGEILWAREVGLVASVLLAVNAYHVHYSQEVRSYALMVFLALLSLFFLCKALQSNKKRFWLGFIFCTSLSIYNHYFALLFLPAEVVFAVCVIAQSWISHRKRNGRTLKGHTSHATLPPTRQSLLFLLSLAVIGLLYIPWLPALQTHLAFFTGYQGATPAAAGSLQASLRFIRTILNEYSGMSGLALLLWVGMFALGLAANDLKRIALVATWVGTPFLFLAIAQSGYRSRPRYVLFILPVLLLVVARGIIFGARALGSRLPSARRARQWPVPSIVALTVLIFVSLSIAPLRDYYLWQKDDWRSAARYLDDNMEPVDVVIADGMTYRGGGDSGTVDRCLSYYTVPYGQSDPRILQVDRALWGELQRLGESDREAWVVVFYRNRPARWDRTMGITLVDFASVSIVRLQQPSGNLLEDSESLLHVLLDLLGPTGASFDVHLALAEIHLQAGNHEQAAFHIVSANLVAPDHELAVADLAEASAPLQPLVHLEAEGKRLGDFLSLPGYSIQTRTLSAGDPVDIVLSWRAVGRMERDYTLFIHVVDEDDQIWAQEDSLLRRGERPTSTWVDGEGVTQRHLLQMSPDTPPGEYAIKVGVYYWETGERLPIWDEEGDRVAGDAILLEHMTIAEE